jgi:hypothetical protein
LRSSVAHNRISTGSKINAANQAARQGVDIVGKAGWHQWRTRPADVMPP